MKQNKIIELKNYRQIEPFDYYAYNKRAEQRFRASERRAWIAQIVDSTVTVAIGVCTVCCLYLTFTMF